jgi:hypothetical protein
VSVAPFDRFVDQVRGNDDGFPVALGKRLAYEATQV